MPSFTNMATLTYNGTTINSNVVTGELQEVLSVVKTALVGSYAANDDITYVVSMVNTGTTAFTGLTVTDNLGAYTFETETLYPLTYEEGSVRLYVNGVLQAAPAVTAGPPLTITGITVPAGGNALVVYEATANRFAPPDTDGEITNQVTVTGAGLTTPLTAEETVTPRLEPALTISKALDPTVVAENGQLTYTFVIQNSGNTAVVATDEVILSDTFDPVLDISSVTYDGEVWTAPTNYTYDSTTGVFTTVAGQIIVPAATYTQNTDGSWTTTPGVSVLTVTGTV